MLHPPLEAAMAKQYLIKSDLLSYTNGDELQSAMSVFVAEARRPNGHPYQPESIYYLCLGTPARKITRSTLIHLVCALFRYPVLFTNQQSSHQSVRSSLRGISHCIG